MRQLNFICKVFPENEIIYQECNWVISGKKTLLGLCVPASSAGNLVFTKSGKKSQNKVGVAEEIGPGNDNKKA